MVEATPKRVFGNAHTYHINSISLNSDQETFLSADDLRINLWHTEVTDQSFSKCSATNKIVVPAWKHSPQGLNEPFAGYFYLTAFFSSV